MGFVLLAGCQSSEQPSTFQCQRGQYELEQRFIDLYAADEVPPSADEFLDLRPKQNPALYFIKMSIGTPPQDVDLILDTGSANLVVPGAPSICPTCKSASSYDPDASETSTDMSYDYTIAYASGNGIVSAYSDQVKIACAEEAALDVDFALMTDSTNLDGVLGLAYKTIALPDDDPTPPFFGKLVDDNLGSLDSIFAMTLCGQRTGSSVILGNVDSRVPRESIQYTPIIEESYYVIDARSLHVLDWEQAPGGAWTYKPGADSVVGDLEIYDSGKKAGVRTIIDSGSTMNFFPFPLVENARKLMLAVNDHFQLGINPEFWRAKPDSKDYAIDLSKEAIAKFPKFLVIARGHESQLISLAMVPETYLKSWLKNKRVFSFREASLLNILGQVFMENHSIEFDIINSRIGFADNSKICGEF